MPQREQGHEEPVWKQVVIFVDPDQFREFCEVSGCVQIRVGVLCVEKPAEVRVKPSLHDRRMRVARFVGILVVGTMVYRPPYGSALARRGAETSQKKLKTAAGPE